ncbi:DNA-directed RNA polymerase I subunit RPA34 [Petaurus breviceps papuanus]|uniref:DNA-directed RNA polymerase I subunit RPA34 n=1 Tax=Petaurus breviceps papuanus TaxID=3040969 RepID=UPI0036DF48DC
MAEAVRSPLCPDDFCPATLPAELPSSLALDALRKPGTELWLIRTPADFSPASFNGCKVPLIGFQTLKSHRNEAGVRQRYHVLSNTSRDSPETLLAPLSSAASQLVPAPALQGILSVIEMPRGKASGQALHAIPTSPPPQIPPGLRPRFQAFGGRQPVLGPPAPTVKAKHSRKRKKSELEAQNPSAQEVLNGVGGQTSAPGQEMPQPMEQVPVKIEEEVTAPSPVKKKKKKKKKEKELEGEVAEPEGTAMELQREAVLSPTKTKKSKKRGGLEERQSEGEVQTDLQEQKTPTSARKSRRRQEAEGEMPGPEQNVGLEEEEEMVGPPPTEGKKEDPGGEMTESLGEAGPSHTKKKKKKKRKTEEGEDVESVAGVPESVTPSPSQGLEEKKKKKKRKH